MNLDLSSVLTWLFGVGGAGGMAAFLYRLYDDWRKRRDATHMTDRERALTRDKHNDDFSMVLLTRAQDELTRVYQTNDRLQGKIEQQETQHAVDREKWLRDMSVIRDECTQTVATIKAEAERNATQLLAQIEQQRRVIERQAMRLDRYEQRYGPLGE